MTIEEWDELDVQVRYDLLFDMLSDMPCCFEDLIADMPVPQEEMEGCNG